MSSNYFKKNIKRIIIFLVIVFISSYFGWKLYAFLNSKIETEPISGQVVDASTNLPIKDAYIISKWVIMKKVLSPQGYSGFPNNEFFIKTKSDEEGKFIIPDLKKDFSLGPLSYGLSYSQKIFVYAPNYSYFEIGKSYFQQEPLKSFYSVKLMQLKDTKDLQEYRSSLLEIEYTFFEYMHYLEKQKQYRGLDDNLKQCIMILIGEYQNFSQVFPDQKEWTAKQINALKNKIKSKKQEGLGDEGL